MIIKLCSRCLTMKVLAEFPRNRTRRDGLSERCRDCKNAEGRALRARQRADTNIKRCSKCRKIKPIAEFYSSDSTHDGLHHYCKPCQRANAKERARIADPSCPAKPCSKCRVIKPLTEFYLHKQRADGRHTQCRLCMRTLQRDKSRKRIDRSAQIAVPLENNGHHYSKKHKAYLSKLPEAYWERVNDPFLREQARLEWLELLRPPRLRASDGRVLDA